MLDRLSARMKRGTVGALGAAALLAAPFMAGQASPDNGTAHSGTAPSGPLAEEMAELLELQPGGVQISDNALAWDDGATVVVWPSPGETVAPAGLGENVRADVVEELGSETLQEQSETGNAAAVEGDAAGAASSDLQPAGSYTSCPYSYYCFYTGSNYDGTRYQFSSTCSSYASNWGFNNQTTSWVNRGGSGKAIYAFDYQGSSRLWYEAVGTQDSYVGSSDNNRMSYWTCTYTG
ncbi:peptidase inhibitor family I36 protein [Phytoactinopolyspora halotolerans]|uniref:Peptidase inhibitor family I36 protein n=1 Tax=Phytoactinopolyspora halotolerans TaxID=1981512 RepID=A0A6L9S622_9ACTN|nr:peptidase inhibitor family I36 protein [Phytoactinopolyspora halotolerans]NEE00529.1 peptidase inhibitor family I36 protein [Phytoactinopolyspora halotolerans]